MSAEEVVYLVVDALEALRVPYMVVGSFSSNLYGVPRSTQDADFVVELGDVSVTRLGQQLGAEFRLEPQMSFETIHRHLSVHRHPPPYCLQGRVLSPEQRPARPRALCASPPGGLID